MKYFGVAWTDFVASLEKTETPVGEVCVWRDKPIEEQNSGLMIPHIDAVRSDRPYHEVKCDRPCHEECFLECFVRNIG